MCPNDVVTGVVGHLKMFNGWLTLAAAGSGFFIRSLASLLVSALNGQRTKQSSFLRVTTNNRILQFRTLLVVTRGKTSSTMEGARI